MAALLTSLHALVTSRYHAQVLAMRTPVITVAVSMDERLANISHEMGLSEHLLHAVAPAEAQPAVGELIDAVRAGAADTLHVALPKPLFLPIPGAAWAGRRRNVRPTDQPKQKGLVANMLALAPPISPKGGRMRQRLPKPSCSHRRPIGARIFPLC